jgi:chromatin segregation and condensation protein Rec8/ScpA/Scc1 (kleisin family)
VGLLKSKEMLPLREAAESPARMDVIGAFLAVLELSKRSLARIVQSAPFSEIFIARR